MDGPTDDVNEGLKRASTQWNWPQRAQAWDKVQFLQLSAMEQDRRLAAREERLAIIDTLLEAVSKVLVTLVSTSNKSQPISVFKSLFRSAGTGRAGEYRQVFLP